MRILVTGAAGFIGFHLSKRLISEGFEVTGLDNINDYYPIGLKFSRLQELGINQDDITNNLMLSSAKYDQFNYIKLNIEDKPNLEKLFNQFDFDIVVNLAAQVGVRYSLKDPEAYIKSNIVGFSNILECSRRSAIRHLVYASSSSIYGLNEKQSFSVSDNVDHPISLYAASKKSNELMAHTYSYLYNLPTTGLRFFTVYGPWGRPDMALFSFTKNILEGHPIDVYNHGDMERDFTYIDDIVDGIYHVIQKSPAPNLNWTGQDPDPASSPAPYRVYNIGNNNPVRLLDFIHEIEHALGKKAKLNMLPLQPGDMLRTSADIEKLREDIQYSPSTPISIGIRKFVEWYKDYYQC